MTSSSSASVPWVAHRVDADRDREHEPVVLAGRDLDAIAVADREPSLRHARDRIAIALDLVLVVDEVPLRVHVRAVLDLDREPVADADQRLPDARDGAPVALDLHLVADAQLALLQL